MVPFSQLTTLLSTGVALTKDSLVLDNVTIHYDGDQLSITCHFKNNGSPSQKCVIVCRKYTMSVLIVNDYQKDTDFPVKLPILEAGTYFVAVFGWTDGVIELFPAVLEQVDVAGNVYTCSLCT